MHPCVTLVTFLSILSATQCLPEKVVLRDGLDGLSDNDLFGWAVARLGDLDGDGVPDLAVGAHGDDDGDTNRGAVWILFLNTDGSVKTYQKISDTEGEFAGMLGKYDYFGSSIANVGDLDGDGVLDLAVGARGDDDGGNERGAVWILFLHSNGTVKSYQKISDTEGGFTGTLDDSDEFGNSAAGIGDLDGDGVPDLVVGAYRDDDGGSFDRGAIWILFLNADGTVKSHQKISITEGGFTGLLASVAHFGQSVTSLGDLDGDGVVDLAVGADWGLDGRGNVWILFLNTDGTVKSYRKINDAVDGFTGTLDDGDNFGHSVTCFEDLDGDGVPDLVVGAHGDDDGGNERGAVWILFLNTDGTLKSNQKISDTEEGMLEDGDRFGSSVISLGDLDGNGVSDLAVGTYTDDDGGTDRGAVWILFLNSGGTTNSYQKISSTIGVSPSPTHSVSASRTPTPSQSPPPSPSRTASPSRTPSPSPSRTTSPSRTVTPSRSPPPSSSPSPSRTASPTGTPSSSPSRTASPTGTPSSSPSRTASPSGTPSSSSSRMASASGTSTPSSSYTASPSASASGTSTPSSSHTTSPSASKTATPTPTSGISSPSSSSSPSLSAVPSSSETPSPIPSPSTPAPIADYQPQLGLVSLDSVWYGDVQLPALEEGQQLVSVSLETQGGAVQIFASNPNRICCEWPSDPETSMWSLNRAGVLEIDLDDDRLDDTDVLRVGVKGTSDATVSFQFTSCRSEYLSSDSIQGIVLDHSYAFYNVAPHSSKRSAAASTTHLEITLVSLSGTPFLYVSDTTVAPTRNMSPTQVPWKSEEQGTEQSITIMNPTGSYYIGVYGHVGGAFRVSSRTVEHDNDSSDDNLVVIIVPIVCVVLLFAVIVSLAFSNKVRREWLGPRCPGVDWLQCREEREARRLRRESTRSFSPGSTMELKPSHSASNFA